MAVKSGATISVSSVPTDTTSIKTVFAVKFKLLVNSSTSKKASAKNVTKVIPLSTANAQRLMSTPPPTLDVSSGETESVKPAPKDGSSTKKESVSQLATFVPHGTMSPETAPNATMDLLFKKENVLSMLIPALFQKATSSARPGSRKPALSAPKEVSSTKMDSVSQLALSAIPLTRLQETASLASMDMTWKEDNVSSLTSTTPNQLMQDAELGTGKIKNVWPAQINGPSMLMDNAFPSLINAKLMLKMVTAPNASKATTSWKDNAFSLPSTTSNLLMTDAEHGTGTTKSALPALTDGSSMLMENACPYLVNAKLTLKMEISHSSSRQLS